MDIVEVCKKMIKDKLAEIEQEENRGDKDVDPSLTQMSEFQAFAPSSIATEKDKNLDKILNQQAHLKRMIDQDNHIQTLKSSLTRVSMEVEEFRKHCTKINEAALKARQECVETHAKEIDQFQMAQMKSIAVDYDRHQQILEHRKKEIQTLKREIEREEKDRDAYLRDVEKKLEKQIQERQRAMRAGGLPFPTSLGNPENSLTNELHDPNHLELASVDEYAPYGTAPHSRLNRNHRGSSGRGGSISVGAGGGGGGGRGRGRRRRG